MTNNTTTTTTTTTHMQDQQAPQAPLRRSKTDRVFTGLSGGLGARFGLNPWLFRVGFIVLSFFGGLGIVLYAVGWLLVPEEGTRDPVAVQLTRRAEGRDASTWIGIGLIALAALIVFGWIGALDSSLFWAALLVVGGVLLYRGDLRVRGEEGPMPPTTEATLVADRDTVHADEGGPPAVPPPSEDTPAPPPLPVPPPKRPRSVLGGLTAGAVLVVLGGMAVAATAGWIEPAFADYVAAALATIGAGLVVGAFVGRSVALIVVGVLLIPLLFITRFVPFPIEGRVGEFTYRPATAAAVEESYELGAGSLTLDLRSLDLSAGDVVTVSTEVGAGEIVVRLPADVDVSVDASVGIGELQVLGWERGGIGLDRSISTGPGSDSQIVLTAEAGFGSIRILQAGR